MAIMPWQISEVTEVAAPLTYYLIRYQLDAVNLALKSLCSIAQDDEELLSRIEAAPVVICGGRGAERIDSIVGLLQAEPEDRQMPRSLKNRTTTSLLYPGRVTAQMWGASPVEITSSLGISALSRSRA